LVHPAIGPSVQPNNLKIKNNKKNNPAKYQTTFRGKRLLNSGHKKSGIAAALFSDDLYF
jgi:hypothetical protein